MSSELAATGPNTPQSSSQGDVGHTWTALELYVLRMMAKGRTTSDLAHRLSHVLAPGHKNDRKRALQLSRRKLRAIVKHDWFRDRLWSETQIVTDLSGPQIMQGVVNRAIYKGDVPAAKFALEIAGRYTPKGDPGPAQVNVVIGGLPRPGYDIEGEATEIE